MIRRISLLLAATVAIAGLSGPAQGQRPALAMLDSLEHGRWELRVRDEGGAVEQLCIGDPHRLIQLRHQSLPCARMVVADDPGEVTVQYTCPGRGYGRTHIRRESSRLIQIDSQGIANGLPFSFAAEGRRVGACHG